MASNSNRIRVLLGVSGCCLSELGRFDEAIDNLQRAVKLDNSLTVLALHAQVLAVAGRTDEAKAVLAGVEKAARSRYFCPYKSAVSMRRSMIRTQRSNSSARAPMSAPIAWRGLVWSPGSTGSASIRATTTSCATSD